MKFCPNCGFQLEGKSICDCGYNTMTKEIDENRNKEYKKKEEENYNRQCDNMTNYMMMNNKMINDKELNPIKMMGIDSNKTEEELSRMTNQTIFNRENDNLKSKDLLKMMEELRKEEEK